MYPGPGPRDLRASDADRELVIAMLGDAAADGRLTLDEHAERSEQALAARTQGELAALTADLTVASAQPIGFLPGRTVTAVCTKDRRSGRWVVPESLAVTAIFGDVELDLRDAVLQSQRITVFATAVAGQIRLIVPAGIAVEMTGRSFMGTRTVRGRRTLATAPPAQAAPGNAVIEVRTLAFAGLVKVITPRRARWRMALRNRQS